MTLSRFQFFRIAERTDSGLPPCKMTAFVTSAETSSVLPLGLGFLRLYTLDDLFYHLFRRH